MDVNKTWTKDEECRLAHIVSMFVRHLLEQIYITLYIIKLRQTTSIEYRHILHIYIHSYIPGYTIWCWFSQFPGWWKIIHLNNWLFTRSNCFRWRSHISSRNIQWWYPEWKLQKTVSGMLWLKTFTFNRFGLYKIPLLVPHLDS